MHPSLRYNPPVPSLHIIYASTSGHTEFVCSKIVEQWKGAEMVRVELAKPEDLLKGDILLLASSTWNTGGIEGQLNPHMHAFVHGVAKDMQLNGKKVLVVGLGDHRYRYLCAAADLLTEFVKSHGGEVIEPALRIVNEPYGQEETISAWVEQVSLNLS